MALSLTNLLVPTYRQMLRALSGWLDKAERQDGDLDALLRERLAPDMYPLAAQILFVCVQAQEAIRRLRDESVPDSVLALARQGREAGANPVAATEIRRHLADTLAQLDALTPDALDAGGTLPIALHLPNGMSFDMDGAAYARDWALPQFNFHLISAYAILRHHGVPLGKGDYVPYMFSYLREGTAPQPAG